MSANMEVYVDEPKYKRGQNECEKLKTANSKIGDELYVLPSQLVDEPRRSNRISTLKMKTFSFNSKCFFCGSTAKRNKRKMGRDVFPVTSLDFHRTMAEIGRRRNDKWAEDVMCRLRCVSDLTVVRAQYHHQCNINFRTGRQIPLQFLTSSTSSKQRKGRPTQATSQEAFIKTMRYLKSNASKQLTVSDLVTKMADLCGDGESYSMPYMKKRVQEHFDGKVMITEQNGKHGVVTFKSAAHSILQTVFENNNKENIDPDRISILKKAAKFIYNDIKQSKYLKDEYPPGSEIMSLESNMKYIPESLQIFLNQLINGNQSDQKKASIGQAIVQAVIPRGVIAPLQIGLGVQVHHLVGSKLLVDILNSLGFSSSYQEVLKFESSAAVTRGTAIQSINNEFIQFIADNVDHNICTLDGLGTFHGMGIIAAITPKIKTHRIIPRVDVSLEEVIGVGNIDLHFYKQKLNSIAEMQFKQLMDWTEVNECLDELEFLLKISKPLKIPSPCWSGTMQMLQKGTFPGTSSVIFMPMIDMSASDMTCIYSTLNFVASQSEKCNSTPVLTFDQPLYWKAFNIVTNEPVGSKVKSVVLRLGGFHSEMSFLGCIGRIMDNTGLKELLETVYADNTVGHMLNGKAINRAIRGHFLVEEALDILLFEKIIEPDQIDMNNNADMNNADMNNNVDMNNNADMNNADMNNNVDKNNNVDMNNNADMNNADMNNNVDMNNNADMNNADMNNNVDMNNNADMNNADMNNNVDMNNNADMNNADMNNNVDMNNNAEMNSADMNNNADMNTSESLDKVYTNDIEQLRELTSALISEKAIPETIKDNKTIQRMINKYQSLKENLSQFRTARLWLQYMEIVDILKLFIRAERTGNWKLHLHSLQQMLPYFASAGHNLYLKSAYVYLQQMRDLSQTNIQVYDAFCKGYHVVRRSDRYWAGLSTDLLIEQTLMRSVKSLGGLTRGRGMSEPQRIQWLLSNPATSEINWAMQDFTEQRHHESEQHKECSKSRIKRDEKDRNTLVEFLRERNPFTEDLNFRNIETGMIADETINVDTAREVGLAIVNNMVDQHVVEYKFKRKNEVRSFGTIRDMKVEGTDMHVEPQLLFQRLLTVSDSSIDDHESIFKYELCGHPSSLFDSAGLLREAQKPLLANAIWEHGSCGVDSITDENVQYVIDGGSLIHKLPWYCGETYESICMKYVDYVERNYGIVNSYVVFDGYRIGPSTKDMTHIRRSRGVTGVKIQFDGKTPFKSKKESVLSNCENKQRLINMLSACMKSKDINVVQATNDADVLIVKTAVQIAEDRPAVIVGEDTDLLILLCCYVNENGNNVYFMPDSKHSLKNKRLWNINVARLALGTELCSLLPLIHAFTGCDTTSRIFGIGKGVLYKKMLKDAGLRSNAKVFIDVGSCHSDIERSGEMLFRAVYNGNENETLNGLRYRKFILKASSRTNMVQVQTLPPSAAAGKFHSFRVYHQVQTWLGAELNPTDWGWYEVANKLFPVMTDIPAAPERLLNIIKCNCKVNCDSKRCSCRKHGLSCSVGCGECRGSGCSNSVLIATDDLE